MPPREAAPIEPSPAEPVVHCLFSEEQLLARIRELAAQISSDYAGKQPVLVGVLKGAWVFLAHLVRHLTVPVRCDFVMLSSYGQATETSGKVDLRLDVAVPLGGEHVLVVEDLLDTGVSSAWLLEHLSRKRPASLRTCFLLDKPERRRVPVATDYVGFRIPNRFVVGFGIDYAERYRELPYVGYLDGPRAATS